MTPNELDLLSAAQLARQASLEVVRDIMDAHQRFSPSWEVGEVDLHCAISRALLARFRAMPQPRFRMAREYSWSAMKNIPAATAFEHPADLVVLSPLVPGDAWADQNCAVSGIIEVKKDWTRAGEDARRLGSIAGSIAGHATGSPPSTARCGTFRR